MGGSWAALALVALLLASVPTQAQGEDARPEELRPIDVALAALPRALASAIVEAQDHLLTEVAQQQLDATYAYVQGFTALPSGSSAMRDEEVRRAYDWTEEAVVTFLALPRAISVVETSGAACRTESETLGLEEGRGYAERGLAAARRLRGVDAEVSSLITRAPPPVELAPVHEASALLGDWIATEVADIEACLLLLLERLGIDPGDLRFLEVQVVPDRIHPTGRIQVFGSVAGATSVRVDAPGIGWTGTVATVNGSFHAERTIPRATAIATHDLTFSAAGLTAIADVTVAKAVVDLDVEAPRRVNEEATFLLRATVTSIAGPIEVDRADLQIRWMGEVSTRDFNDGRAVTRLPAPTAGGHVLEVRYPGTDILEAAVVRLDVMVVDPAAEPAPPAETRLADRIEDVLVATYPWWLIVLLLLVLLAALVWTLKREHPQPPMEPVVPVASRTSFPGADSFAAAVALLFRNLRRLGLVPPGRTVREWLQATDQPSVVADRFEAVRYGPFHETPTLAEKGREWARRTWQRWIS